MGRDDIRLPNRAIYYFKPIAQTQSYAARHTQDAEGVGLPLMGSNDSGLFVPEPWETTCVDTTLRLWFEDGHHAACNIPP